MVYRIGVDVGGTNTDAVVMSGRDIVSACKVPTSADVTSGMLQALRQALAAAQVQPEAVAIVVIGTTHFTNAVVERRGLTRTGIVRLCLPAAQSLPPMIDWPEDLKQAVAGPTFMAHGGLEFDGTPIWGWEPEEIRSIGRQIAQAGCRSIAVTGTFAPVRPEYELEAARILAQSCPEAAITVSSQVGPLGFLERESATILNASLRPLAAETIRALREGVKRCGLDCPVYLSQNDGTLMEMNRALELPVLTCASGPTNSMRGAAFLSGRKDAVVIDVGGTTTDVGSLQHGFPRLASTTVDIGGVRTNFRMPDVVSIGLGGGSIVQEHAEGIRVGPQSVGFRLTTRARIFGGDTLTTTDIAVAAGRLRLGDPGRVRGLAPATVVACMRRIEQMLESVVERCRVSALPVPIVAVGGGSVLAPDRLAGLEVIRPEHYSCANAIGAAIAQVSGEVDRVYSLDHTSRAEALASAEREAKEQALRAGAQAQSLTVTEKEDVPLAYLKGNATRIRIKVVGDLPL